MLFVGDIRLEDGTCGPRRSCSAYVPSFDPMLRLDFLCLDENALSAVEAAFASSSPNVPNNASKKNRESASVILGFACLSPKRGSPRKAVGDKLELELAFE